MSIRGKYTVLHLAKHHAKVYLCARSEEKAENAIQEIKNETQRSDLDMVFLKLDLLNLSSVTATATDFMRYEIQSNFVLLPDLF